MPEQAQGRGLMIAGVGGAKPVVPASTQNGGLNLPSHEDGNSNKSSTNHGRCTVIIKFDILPRA